MSQSLTEQFLANKSF